MRAAALKRVDRLWTGSSIDKDMRRVARRQFLEKHVRWRLGERYDLVRYMPVRGIHHIERAQRDGRGAVVVGAHIGYPIGVPLRLGQAGHPPVTVAGGWLQHVRNDDERRQAQVKHGLSDAGVEIVFAGSGAFARAEAAVRSGRLCFIAADMPGSLPTTYLGKRSVVGQAAYRIPWSNGCAAVPAFMRRRGFRAWIEVHPPIEPGDHDDFESFARAVKEAVEHAAVRDIGALDTKVAALLWPDGDSSGARPNRAYWRPTERGERARS